MTYKHHQGIDPKKQKYPSHSNQYNQMNDQNYLSSMAGSPMTESFFRRSDMYSVDMNNELYDVEGNQFAPPQFGKRSNQTAKYSESFIKSQQENYQQELQNNGPKDTKRVIIFDHLNQNINLKVTEEQCHMRRMKMA